ncbi:Rpp20 subunit of nuclear RNase MRP and P-domain-containing protein [Sphaerosporella brunnea]|uniref:Rpp20 subunit of nuclear RNase MRP and P-domain-containing protein n=1 Tax=Sphaerosporella brunnea TaxID=1250544 RepID=A0A5J5EY93_9PEZI|nr:Rpp20 subunit of nuclear RNase MRP and P-domain-containing protein [Sphaerosporella brunnea]
MVRYNKPTVHNASTTKLPSHKTLQKRPLLHPAIPTPKSSAPRIIYVGSKTPHGAVIKKVDKYLEIIDAPLRDKKGRAVKRKAKKEEEGVTLKATGFAICSALALGNFFMERGERVEVRTASMTVVDDVVDRPEGEVGKKFRVRKKKKVELEKEKEETEEKGVMEVDDKEEEDVDMVTRTTSAVEIFITRKKEDT